MSDEASHVEEKKMIHFVSGSDHKEYQSYRIVEMENRKSISDPLGVFVMKEIE